jgi:UDP-2,4-diacetamido-2,4,6-trideoxy-beta-L-altropyranose hydrolase
LIENSPLRQAMSRKGMQRVDGRGVSRVVSELGYSGVEIRPVTTNDSKRLFGWRNHETIRAVSRNSDVITWDDHQKWFSAVMGDAKRCLLIGERDGLPLGVVRFDIKGRTAEVSVYVVPGTAGSGRGRDLLQAAERWLVAGRPEVTTLHAHVLGGNDRSESLFVGSGYDVDSSTYSKSLPQ